MSIDTPLLKVTELTAEIVTRTADKYRELLEKLTA